VVCGEIGRAGDVVAAQIPPAAVVAAVVVTAHGVDRVLKEVLLDQCIAGLTYVDAGGGDSVVQVVIGVHPATTLQRQACADVLVVVVVEGDLAATIDVVGRRTIQADLLAVVDVVVRDGDIVRSPPDVQCAVEGQVAVGGTIAFVVHSEQLIVVDPHVRGAVDADQVGIIAGAAQRTNLHVLHNHVVRTAVDHDTPVGRGAVGTFNGHASGVV